MTKALEGWQIPATLKGIATFARRGEMEHCHFTAHVVNVDQGTHYRVRLTLTGRDPITGEAVKTRGQRTVRVSDHRVRFLARSADKIAIAEAFRELFLGAHTVVQFEEES